MENPCAELYEMMAACREMVVAQPSAADLLLSLAEEVRSVPDRLIIAEGMKWANDGPRYTARVALALRFADRPNMIFRAAVEDWDMDRIVREMTS